MGSIWICDFLSSFLKFLISASEFLLCADRIGRSFFSLNKNLFILGSPCLGTSRPSKADLRPDSFCARSTRRRPTTTPCMGWVPRPWIEVCSWNTVVIAFSYKWVIADSLGVRKNQWIQLEMLSAAQIKVMDGLLWDPILQEIYKRIIPYSEIQAF